MLIQREILQMSTSENGSGTKFYLVNVKLINSKVASACTSNMESRRTHG